MFTLSKELNYKLSITGHSLGGWLTEIGAHFIKTKYEKES